MQTSFKLGADYSLVLNPDFGRIEVGGPSRYVSIAIVRHHMPRFVYDKPLELGERPPDQLIDGVNGKYVQSDDECVASFHVRPSQLRAIASAMLSEATEARA